jgi:hypothetical protein
MGDEMFDSMVTQSPLEEDWGLNKAQNWKLKLCWVKPRNCFLTGKPLWGKRAYHGVRTIHGPGEPVYEDYWIDRDQFLLWNLKR